MKTDKNSQVEDQSSQTESLSTSSCSSFNSDVVIQGNTKFPKPHILVRRSCPDDSHLRKVDVMVHHCIECSPSIDEDVSSNIYSNVCIQLQKNRQINRQSNESSSDSNIVHKTTLPFVFPSIFRTNYIQDETKKSAGSEKTIVAFDVIDSYEEKSIKQEKSKTF